MKRPTVATARSRKAPSSTGRRVPRDPIDPTPRVIERKHVKDAVRDSRRVPKRGSPSKKKPVPAKAASPSARQVGSAIGSVLGKVIGKVEQTVAKVMPKRTSATRTASKRRTA